MSNSILFYLTLVSIVLLVFIYKRREENESNLGFKIVGYCLLGGFTFVMNDFPIPLGFLMFVLFVRPTTNVKTKHNAVFLGLACFILQLIIPAVDEYVYERPREVAGVTTNIFQVDFIKDWFTIQEHMKIDPNARLEKFRVEYRPDGQISRLSYNVVGQSKDGFIYYDIRFSSETKEYAIQRHKVGDQWLQYDRSIDATRFFEVLDQVQVRNLSLEHLSEGNIVLSSDGEMTSYAIKDRRRYLIQGMEIKEITNDQLPIKGYYISMCRMSKTDATFSGSTRSYSCKRDVDYFFDVAHRK
ncbi:hypothetical protein [Brevibacillus sp. NRS-1366]|uniref:hypothetical protein n=1 Tax=Brevibacillus sp. NRS-1366 TaxID=3233899 RepID=UPI003D2475F7